MKKSVKLAAYYLTFAIAAAAQPATAYAEPEEIVTETSSGAQEMEETGGILSSDNSLSSIEIVQGELVPEFSPEQLTYTMTVSYETDRITLRAQTNDGSAKKTITGTSDLVVGENTVVIKVTAEDGSVRIYQIAVTREEGEETEASEGQEENEGSSGENGESESSMEEPSQEEPSQEEPSREEPSQEPVTAGTESISAGLNEADQFVVNPAQEEDSFLDTYRLPLVIGLAVVLIILCIVAAVLLLKRRPGEDEDFEILETDEYTEQKAEWRESNAEEEPERNGNTDELISGSTEADEDEDFDFLDI